jgi:hypothetical protein
VAGGSHANSNGISTGLGKSKLGIKGGYSIDLIIRNLQKSGNVSDGFLGNIPELFLNPLEDGD